MDSTGFDDLPRTFSRGDCTRRSAVKLLSGALLGGALASLGLGQAAAACKKVGAICRGNDECCAGSVCEQNRCRCAPGRKDCNGDGRCENLQRDDANCGSCGNRCPAGAFCRNGRCLCPGGQAPCNGVCCPSGQSCLNGTCDCPTRCGDICCRDGETCCDGVCRDLDEDAGACGNCDTTCGANQVCEFGDCCVPPGGSGCTSNQDCCNFPTPAFCGVGGVCKTTR